MSIFDLYDDDNLPGDKSKRTLKNSVLEFEYCKEDSEGEEIFREKPTPIWIPYLLCLLILGVLIAQLLNLQISHGSFNRTLAEGNRVRIREIAAPRGLIVDSKNKVLASNTVSYNLDIYPLDLPKASQTKDEILKKLSEISGVGFDEIQLKTNPKSGTNPSGYSGQDPVSLKENIDRDAAMLLEVKTVDLPGVVISKKPIRQYEEINGLGPILGYVGEMTDEDLKENPTYKSAYEIGKTGLELQYEKLLKGIPGISEIEVDSRGRAQRQLSSTEPAPGNNLVLNINAGLEQKMASELSAAMRNFNSPGGAAVAMNPKTGQILGIISEPTYDNNLFSRQTASEEYQKLIENPAKPMFNRAISGTYPSGSTIKPVVAAAGLDDGIITPLTTIDAPGEIKVGNYVYPDWKVHGLTDVRKAIAESVNIYFYAIAGGWDKIKGLGIAKMDNYLKRFGFGQKTGIDLPGEAVGLVPDPAWKDKNKHEMWYLGDTYHLGIGQGDFLVTPLQMAVAYSAIANNGELLAPQLVNKITDKNGVLVQDFPKNVIKKDFISKDALQVVREGMRQTVTSGSGQLLKDLPVMVAAKTGTAQFGSEGKTHAWMATFAPYNDPQIVLIVLVEEGGEGYAAAGPAAHNILNWYFQNNGSGS